MFLRRCSVALLAAVHLLAGLNPAVAAAAASVAAEHCAPDATAHAGMHHAEPAQQSCGHECRECAACAMLPPAVLAAAAPPPVADYLASATDFRLPLHAEPFLRPPIYS